MFVLEISFDIVVFMYNICDIMCYFLSYMTKSGKDYVMKFK